MCERCPRLRTSRVFGFGVNLIESAARFDHHIDALLTTTAHPTRDRTRAFQRINVDVRSGEDLRVRLCAHLGAVRVGIIAACVYSNLRLERNQLQSDCSCHGSFSSTFVSNFTKLITKLPVSERGSEGVPVAPSTCTCTRTHSLICSLHRKCPAPTRGARQR